MIKPRQATEILFGYHSESYETISTTSLFCQYDTHFGLSFGKSANSKEQCE